MFADPDQFRGRSKSHRHGPSAPGQAVFVRPARLYRFIFHTLRLSMDGETYPGKGLSLSQLLFALNQELKRVVCSAGCVVEDGSKN